GMGSECKAFGADGNLCVATTTGSCTSPNDCAAGEACTSQGTCSATCEGNLPQNTCKAPNICSPTSNTCVAPTNCALGAPGQAECNIAYPGFACWGTPRVCQPCATGTCGGYPD